MRPDPQSGAMRDLVAKLMDFDDVNRFIGEMTSGVAIRYDLGSAREEVGQLIGDASIRLGEVEASLYDVMQDGKGVFLDASTEGNASKLIAATTQKVHCASVVQGPSMLIRPDACVAWGDEGSSLVGLEEALRRWFVATSKDEK